MKKKLSTAEATQLPDTQTRDSEVQAVRAALHGLLDLIATEVANRLQAEEPKPRKCWKKNRQPRSQS